MKETPRVRYLEGDGRVFLNRRKETYDLILVDAFHGGYVPFHLLTREFYSLLRQRLAPGGAVAFNVHDGTKLYASTLLTLALGFFRPAPLSFGRRRDDHGGDRRRRARAGDTRAAGRCAAGEIPLPLPASRPARAPRREGESTTQKGELLTDDFTPVNLYDTMGREEAEEIGSCSCGAKLPLCRPFRYLDCIAAGHYSLGGTVRR